MQRVLVNLNVAVCHNTRDILSWPFDTFILPSPPFYLTFTQPSPSASLQSHPCRSLSLTRRNSPRTKEHTPASTPNNTKQQCQPTQSQTSGMRSRTLVHEEVWQQQTPLLHHQEVVVLSTEHPTGSAVSGVRSRDMSLSPWAEEHNLKKKTGSASHGSR